MQCWIYVNVHQSVPTLHNQPGDTHAVAEVTCANEVLKTLDAVLSLLDRPYQATQLIAVRSGGGTIPLFPALDSSSVNSFSVAL